MSGFARPEALAWLWWLVAAAALLWFAWWRGRVGLRRFVASGLQERMAPGVSGGRALVKSALLLCGLGLAVVAYAGPRGAPTERDVDRLGRDICFIVDISRSMLADDLAPNRLERAKLWISDVLDELQGDRVAIVSMAGRPELSCPLTHDYGFARFVLGGLDPRYASRGGTNIGDAIRLALDDVFTEAESGQARFRDIVLITDGEDTVDSLPIEAARQASEQGVRLVILGLGDPRGSRIPLVDEDGRRRGYVQDETGRDVVARLDVETLREMARASETGVFLNVGVREAPLDTIFTELMADAERRRLEKMEGVTYEQWFQLFAIAAFGLLLMEPLIAGRSRR